MEKSEKFSDYLKRSYLRNTMVIFASMALLFAAFMIFGLHFTLIGDNNNANASICSIMSKEYNIYSQQIVRFSEDPAILNAVMQKGDTTDVNRKLYAFVDKQKITSVFVLLDAQENIVSTNLYIPNQLICKSSMKMNEAVGMTGSSPKQVYSTISGIQYDNHQKTSYLFCRGIQSQGKIVGYICFDLLSESIDNLMRENKVDIIELTDRFDNAFYYTQNSVVNTMGKSRLDWKNKNSVIVDQKPYYGVSTSITDSDLKVVTLSSTNAQNQIFIFGIIFLCCIIVFMVLLIFKFANNAAKNSSRSVDALIYAVEQCSEGNINYRIQSRTFDEFQILYDKFNEMMIRIQELLKNNSELLELKRKMEVKQLEEQFNPHFVFNVMETLKYEILIDPKQASQMVVAFANLMRYSINYGNSKVPIRTEINYIRDYLLVQKMRYNKRLSYEIDIDDSILDYYIPKLLIQPVVENCLAHGAENVKQINIKITGKTVCGIIYLVVEDNGQGIDEQRLKRIKADFKNEDAMPERIGLYFAYRTIRLFYGEDYGLEIDSKYGCATKVIIKIPAEGDVGIVQSPDSRR